eukprot:4825190-Amphidinium_carterae.1
MPVRTSGDNVGEIFRLFLTTHAKVADMKSTISTNFMPNTTKGGIESTSKVVLSLVGALLQ